MICDCRFNQTCHDTRQELVREYLIEPDQCQFYHAMSGVRGSFAPAHAVEPNSTSPPPHAS